MSSYTDRLNELKKKYVSAEREEEKKTKPTAPVGSSYRDRLDALKEKYPEGTGTKKKAQSTLSQIEKLDSSINKQKNRVNTNRGRSAGLSVTKPTAAETKLRQDIATRNEQRRELLSIDADKIENNKNRDAVLGAQLKVAKDQAREAGYVNPRSKTSSAKKAEKTEAQKQFATINKDKSRTEKLVRYEDKVYADTFGGQTGANFAVGRLSQDSSLAWSEYLDNPTEKNRRYAESLDATLQSFMTRNEKALDEENVKLSWVSKSLANYMPQFLDQASYSIQGGIVGAAAGTLIAPGAGTVKGAKVGVTMASGAYSYKTMRGAAFKALIESGVSEETARAAASDEAFVSALIEMADTGIDMLTLGGSSLLTALGKSGWKGVGKLATEWAGQDTVKRFALAAAKYGLNVGSEALEEATQEAVSIANQNRVQRGETGKGSLVGAASKVFRDALTGTNKEAADQIWAAATEGAKIAAMMGGADVITTQTTAQIVSRVQAESVGAGIRAAGKELDMLAQAKTDYGKDTKTYKLATTLESQMKSSGRTTLTDLETGRLFEQMTRDDAEAQVKAENKVKKESTAAKKTAKVDAQTEADLVEMATSEDQATAEYAAAQLSNPEVTVVSPVAQKLMSAGVKNDVAVEQAALVQKMQAGHKLTDAEIQKLRVSDPAVQATIEAETGVKVPGTTKAAKRQLNQSIIKTAAEVKAQRERARQAVAEQQAGEVLVAQARANAQAAADAAAPATEAVPSETVVTPTGNPATGDSEANVSSDAAVATLLDLLEESKGDRVMASALQQNTIEFADGTVQNYVDFVESYKAEHKGATDEDATRVFYEWKRQNQMGQKVPGTAKQTKSSAAAKTEQKASVGETGETPAEVRFFAGKQLSKEAAAEAKRLEQESLKKFGEFLGVEVEFQEFDGADADANGFYLKEQNKVVLNSRKLNGLRHTTRIFLHEVTHPAQDADVNLTRDILNMVKEARGEGYLNMLIKRTKDAYVAFYKKNNYDLGTLNVASEVAADYMMNIFESRAALDRIAGVKPSLVSKMLKRLGVIRRATGLNASVTSHLDKLADRMVEAQRKAKEQKSTATQDSEDKNKAPAPPLRYFESNAQSGDVHSAEVPTNASATNITDSSSDVKKQFSVDSEGNQLSTKQQEFFKDSKVRDKEGKLLPVYHGTPSGGFTEFKLPEYFSVMNSAQGAGYYFTDKRNASQYKKGVAGKSGVKPQLYQVYLNITNPMEIEQFSTGIITDEVFRAIAARGNYAWGVQHTDVEKILRNNKFDADRLAELVRLFRGEDILTAMREVTGYDGVRYTDKWGDIWVAWDKSQIKNTDNKAPTADPDIRYSVDMTGLSEADQTEANAILGRLKNQARFAKYGASAYGAYTAERMDREIRNSSSSTVMDYAKSYIAWVDPVDFIYATTTNEDGRAQLKKEAGTLDLERLRNETQPIHLTVDFEDGRIVGHEGRHRMLALQDAGVGRVAVIIDAWNDDRHHTKPISIMNLRGQNFFNIGRGVGFYLHDMLPLSKRYAGVAKEYFAGTPKRGVQYSIDAKTDADYMDAVKRGDMTTAQRMVDEAAKAKGYTVRGNHGTTNLFTVFDTAKSNIENDWGRGIYATTSAEDAQVNYASGDGADLTHRIERLAEMMEYWDEYEDMDYDQRVEAARNQLSQGENRMLQVAIRMENPVVVERGNGGTFFTYESEYNEDTDEYSEPSGTLVDVIEKMKDIIYSEYDWASYDADKLDSLYEEAIDYGGLSAYELQSSANDWLVEVEDEDGNAAYNEILRKALEQVGFDGIVDKSVPYKFGELSGRRYGGMRGVTKETTHFIAFNSSQVKLTDPVTYDENGNIIPLSKRFNEKNADIRYSIGLGEPWVPDWIEDATLLDADLGEMSVEQRDFFADSKARDEHGRLIPMYHGTNTPNFTVFDPSFSDDGISLFFTSNPNVADTYTRQQDEGRDVDPYNLITEDSTAEQFNAAQEHVGGGLRVVKVTEEWNAEMRQKAAEYEKQYLDAAVALATHAQELAGDDEVLRNYFAHAVHVIRSVIESGEWKKNATLSVALDNLIYQADVLGREAERTLRTERIDLRKLDDERQMYRDSILPEEEFGKYLMTETNETVEFRVEGKENYLFTHFIPGTEKEMVKRAIERSHWVAEHSLGNRYQVYLNLKNPLVVECGTDYSGRKDVNIYHDYHEPDTYYVQLDDAEDSLSVTLSRMELVPFIVRAFDEETRLKVLNQLQADFKAYKDKWGDLDESQVDHNITLQDVEVNYVQPSYWNSIPFMGRRARTRDIAKWAQENGHDGVIFKNLKDTGGWAAADPGASTVMIAFESNQVKATTNRKPTEDKDIRYSVNSLGELVGEDEVLTQGMTVTEDGKRYSIRSMRHDIADGKMFRDLVKHCKWTQEEVDDLQGKIEHLLDIMEPHRDILDLNETFSRDEREFSPYKANSDPLYKISMDFSTLCSKRLLTQYVIENLQLQENRPMSAEEQMAIRDLLIEYGKQEKALQVACTMCYVEAARLKAPEQMNRWLADPEYFIRDYFGKKNKAYKAQVKRAQEDFKESKGYDRNAAKKQMSSADVTALNLIGPELYAKYKPSEREQQIIERAKKLPASTYLTADNLARLSENEPEIYDAYVTCIRDATRSKALETAVPYYYGDSKRKVGKKGKTVSDKFIAAVNSENGMRFSSWSDWRIQHLLDFITAVIENSVRGAAMHGYTKYVDEVRALGKTGMMFNMSGVPTGQTGLDENGNLLFSETDSVDIDAAKQARNEFPETSGIQCIGVSDDHIRKLLQSDFIDYVIPYHVSGMNADLRRMGGIHKWEDYTDVQHAKALRDNAGKEPTFSEFFVGYNTSLSGIDAMKASAERYKRLCKERGLTPKFNDFAGEENYWKLLVDRKMVNQVTGQLIEQKPVKADFDFGLIEQIVGQYVKNFDSGLESRALAYVKKNWDSIPSRIEELKKRDEAKPKSKGKKTKSTPVDRAAKTLANATLAAQPKQYSVDSSAHNTDTGYEEGSIQDRVLTLLKSGTVDDAVTLLQEWADELTSGRVEAKPEERAFRDALMAKRKVSPEMAAANRKKLDDLVEDFGKIAPGEKRTREVIIPAKVAEGRGVSKHVRTVLESEHTPEWFVAEAERLVAENAEGYTYDIATDRAAMRHIQDRKSRSFQRNLQEWEDTFNSVDKAITKNDIALGEFLYTEAVKAGDVATATRLVAELSAAGTRAGQTVQAMSLLKKLTPSGQLYYLQQAVERLNRDLRKQGKEQKIIVDADLAKALIEAKTTEEMQKAMDALLQDIANQAPVTVMDKWNAWRYLAMLGNPRTHIRNIASNAVFAPAVFLKDIIGAAAQLPMAKENRTKNLGQAFASLGYGATFGKVKTSPYVEFADADFAAMADVIRGGGKQNPSDLIRDKRPIFKGKATQWINKASKANSQWMESEDAIFLKWHYVRALSQYLAAQDADLSTLETTPEGRNQLVQAREWAVQEAQKATFRDASAFASALSRFEQSNKAAGVLVGGLLPFKKTPINILKRGVEYSPFGVISMVRDGLNHKQSAARFVDRLAASLTGTGIMALGFYLASQGLLRGSGSSDDKEKEFEELQGAQNYALQLSDGTSFTIDWMAPSALPLFVGCEINKVLNSEGKFTAADFADTLSLLAEPMFNLSMLDGLNSTLKSAGYSDFPLTPVGTSILTGYVGQAVPTLLGQIARTIDGTRRTTYIDKNKNTVDWLDRTIQYNMTKVPGASQSLTPKLDAWGRTDDQSSFLLGALENFLSPGYVNSKKTSPMENELMRLYKATGSSAVLPKAAAKYFTVGGKRYDLSGEEWTTFQTELGQGSYEMLTRLVNSRAYGSLSDAQKVKAVEDVYEYAKEQAKTAAVGSYVSDKSWVTKAEKLAGKGVSVEDYIMYSVIGSETSGQNTLDIVGITWLDDTAKAQLISSAYAKSLTGGNTFTDPYKTGYQYIMTSAQVERYLDQYETSWMKEYRSLIATNQYKAADNKAKADMLDKLKSSVATDTKKWMARQLSNSGIKSTKKP